MKHKLLLDVKDVAKLLKDNNVKADFADVDKNISLIIAKCLLAVLEDKSRTVMEISQLVRSDVLEDEKADIGMMYPTLVTTYVLE